MQRIEVKDTASSASCYQTEDGRIFRIHMSLVTPPAALATTDYVEVETRGYQIDKNGNFVVDDNGEPVMLRTQRARIPLANVRSGHDSVKGGWIKQALPEDEEELASLLDQHKKLKSLPKTGEAGDIKRVGDELYHWTDGLYESVRRQRMNEVSTPPPQPLDTDAVNALLP